MRDWWDICPEAGWEQRDRYRHFSVSGRNLRLFACACGRADLLVNNRVG